MIFEPTNSLASINFDILKMDAVEDPLINVNKLATLDFEECYTAQAVAFINECRNEITTHKISFYKSLNEATSDMMILESFSDYFSKVKDIIDKFIKFIKKLAEKFATAIMQLVKSDKFIKSHKNDFNNIESDMEFDFNGYEYTFSPSIPNNTAVLGFNNSLFDELYNNAKRELTAQSVKDTVIAMDLEKDYNEFRARLLGEENGIIYISEFSDELYKVFRNGESSQQKITADATYIRKCLNRYLSYENMKKEVEKQRSDIERSYNTVKKQVEDITRRNYDLDKQAFLTKLPADHGIIDVETTAGGTKMAGELMLQLDTYVRAKVDQIQEYSNIHLIAFGAKLDAMKECLGQDRAVLYTALRKSNVPFEKKKGGNK